MHSQFKSLLTLTKYSFISKIRNPSTIFFGFAFPLIFILVFGLIGQGTAKFDVGITSNSLKSGPIYDAIVNNSSLNIITDRSDNILIEKLSKGKIPALVEIQQVNISLGGQNLITYKVNLKTTSADVQGGNTITSIISNEIIKYNNPPSENKILPAKIVTSNVEGRKYQQIDFILPGQLDFSLLSIGVISIAFSFLTLKKTLVIKRIFATPASKFSILASQVLSTLAIALLQAIVIILIGHFVFNFTLVNGLWTILTMLILTTYGLLIFFGFGLFVSTLAKDENALPSIANLITLPQLILSGSFFPIDIFPAFLQPIARIMPLTFLNDAMRAVSFEGATLVQVFPQILGLTIWGVIIYLIVLRTFKWE